jgi:hypothetical protein
MRSFFQLIVSYSSPRTVSTILAPCKGGLEYIGLALVFTREFTILASDSLSVMIDRQPARSPYRPKFFEKD